MGFSDRLGLKPGGHSGPPLLGFGDRDREMEGSAFS
jgi:hypothetical protein